MSQEIPVVYPAPQIDPPAATSHRSNGSFGAVFIVLAIIVVVSAIACFLGRLCSKRSLKAHDKQSKDHHRGKEGKKQKQAFPKKEWEPKHNQTRDGDIEFGFDSKRVPSSKVAANNGDHSAMGPSRSFRNGDQFKGFPGGDAAMGPGPMRFPGGDHAAMGPSRSFRNGEFKGEMRFPEGGGEHRAGPVPY